MQKRKAFLLLEFLIALVICIVFVTGIARLHYTIMAMNNSIEKRIELAEIICEKCEKDGTDGK